MEIVTKQIRDELVIPFEIISIYEMNDSFFYNIHGIKDSLATLRKLTLEHLKLIGEYLKINQVKYMNNGAFELINIKHRELDSILSETRKIDEQFYMSLSCQSFSILFNELGDTIFSTRSKQFEQRCLPIINNIGMKLENIGYTLRSPKKQRRYFDLYIIIRVNEQSRKCYKSVGVSHEGIRSDQCAYLGAIVFSDPAMPKLPNECEICHEP